MYDLEWLQLPCCPYCQDDLDDPWELDLSDRENVTIFCPNCCKEYKITAYVSYEFKSEKIQE